MEQWAGSNSMSLIHKAKLPKSLNSAIWKKEYNPDQWSMQTKSHISCSSMAEEQCQQSQSALYYQLLKGSLLWCQHLVKKIQKRYSGTLVQQGSRHRRRTGGATKEPRTQSSQVVANNAQQMPHRD